MVLSTAVLGVGSVAATTSGTPIVDASAGATTYTVGGAGVVVDPAIGVSDSAGGTYDGARVVIQNLQAGDQLAFTAQGGISGSYDGSSGVLTLTGSATAVEYQAVFRSVIYSSAASSPDLSDRQISFSIGAILPNDDNGHFYEFVPADDITWTEARDDAASRTLYGLQGYLVTVTSAEENTFVASKLQGQGWLGASDAASEGTWNWVTGPESGTHFSNQDQLGFCSANTIVSGVGGQYVNWQAGEPNDCGGEDYAHFRTNGEWNDYPDLVGPEHDIQGYVVEYGGMAGDPAATWSDTKAVVVDETPVVITSAGDTDYQLADPAVVVDSAVIADDANGDSFDGARVVIQNLDPDDVLTFTAQHGVTGSYDAIGGVLSLTGTATAAQYQDVFRSVTFANANPTADVTDRRITFALGSTLPSDATGHFYEYVSAGGISWHDANAAASGKSYLGLQGYLATVTSQAENDFIGQKLQGSGWIGASDDTAFSYISKDANGNDRWYWVTGPEAGTHFWTGEANGNVEPGQYANWQSGEPNDYFGPDSENYAHFYASGVWNDFPGDQYVDGYVVEYGGFGSESAITWQDTKTVAVTAPPTNVAPVISADADSVTADEGSTATNGGSFGDDDGDAVTLSASIGAIVDNNDGTWTWSLPVSDGPAVQLVTVTAIDDEESTSVSFEVTVTNVAPTVTADSASVTVDEGQTATNAGSYADPGDDTVTLSASAGTIVDNNDGTWSWSFDAIDGSTDSQLVTVTATDSDNAVSLTSFQLNVNNVAPVFTAADVDDGVASSPVTATGAFTDAGIADTHTVAVDWGDGTTSSATVTQGAGSGSFVGSHAYATGGVFDVTVTVADDNGGVDVYTESITVAHLATIDVKPDSSENPVNPKVKGVLPVAIINTGDLDLTQVDVPTLRLSATEGGAGAAAAHGGHLEDVDGDGDLDLMLHFVNQDIGLSGDTTAVYLSGFMTDGVPVVGSDMVDPVPVGDGDDDDDASAGGNGNGKGNGRDR